MGLNISNDCWNSSYSSFGDFRATLASLAGIYLDEMVGFGGTKKFPSKKKEPLVVLLDHSDCDGDIKHKDLLPLLNRMQAVLKENPKLYLNNPQFNVRMLNFIAGLKVAIENNENLYFS